MTPVQRLLSFTNDSFLEVQLRSLACRPAAIRGGQQLDQSRSTAFSEADVCGGGLQPVS